MKLTAKQSSDGYVVLSVAVPAGVRDILQARARHRNSTLAMEHRALIMAAASLPPEVDFQSWSKEPDWSKHPMNKKPVTVEDFVDSFDCPIGGLE